MGGEGGQFGGFRRKKERVYVVSKRRGGKEKKSESTKNKKEICEDGWMDWKEGICATKQREVRETNWFFFCFVLWARLGKFCCFVMVVDQWCTRCCVLCPEKNARVSQGVGC